MGRLVKAVPRAGAKLAAGADEDKYLERVAKYVPTEVLVPYLTVTGLITGAPEDQKEMLWGIFFIVFWVLAPAYIYAMSQGGPRWKHMTISFIAFAVWAYAVGGGSGIFGADGLGWYQSYIASIVLIMFSVISGLFVPKTDEA